MLCWPRARADFRGVGVEVWVTRFACEDSTAPCVPRSRAREKISADGTEKVADVQKNCVWYMYNVTLETTYIHPGTNFRADLVQNMP